MTTCAAKKFACYLRDTRAVSALEYAILGGVAVVVILVAYENFRDDIREAITTLVWQLRGAH